MLQAEAQLDLWGLREPCVNRLKEHSFCVSAPMARRAVLHFLSDIVLRAAGKQLDTNTYS